MLPVASCSMSSEVPCHLASSQRNPYGCLLGYIFKTSVPAAERGRGCPAAKKKIGVLEFRIQFVQSLAKRSHLVDFCTT